MKRRSRLRLLLGLVAILLCVVITPIGILADGNTIVKAVVSSDTINIGDEFYVLVAIKPSEAISGGMMDINFNRDVLEAERVTEGDLFKQNGGGTDFSGGTIDNEKGTIVGIGDVNGEETITGVGFFTVIKFIAIGSGNGNAVINNVKIRDSNGQDVIVSVVNCDVVVNGNSEDEGDGGIVVSPPSQGNLNNSKGSGEVQTNTNGDTQVETTPSLSTSVSSLVTMIPLLIIILTVLAIVSIIATGDFQIAMIIGVVILIMVAVSFLGSVNNSINGLL